MKRHAILTMVVAMGCAGVLGLCGCSDPTKDLESDDPAKVIKAVRASANRASDETADRLHKVIQNNPDTMVAAEGTRGLGAMRRPRAVKILAEVASGVNEKRGAIRQEAVIQLGMQKDPAALSTLRQVLKSDPDPRVRAAAATSISRQRSLPDVALLVEVAEGETDPVVQARAVGSVERLVGLKFGYDPKASPAERQKALLRMRSIALTAASSLEQRVRRGKNP